MATARVVSEHRALFDDRGVVLRFTAMSRPGAPMAASARVPEGRVPSCAARAVAHQLPGWIVQTEDFALAAAMIKAGARPVRHAFVMQRDLRHPIATTAVPRGLRAEPLDAARSVPEWRAVVPSWHAAYPPDHPDHFHGGEAESVEALQQLVSGKELGPMHATSTLAIDADGTPVAGIIVTVTAFDPPWGGPWICDIWRDPRLRGSGVGPWLLASAQRRLREDGFVSLGLAVSVSNPARRSYESAGFRVVAETQTVQMGADAPVVTFPA
ncbi:MAG: GNAT family N-acetyltransferase [Candidatus Nanopelagicales bacterium]